MSGIRGDFASLCGSGEMDTTMLPVFLFKFYKEIWKIGDNEEKSHNHDSKLYSERLKELSLVYQMESWEAPWL